MKHSGLARIARDAALVAAVLLCLAAFLSLPLTGSQAPAALSTDSPHVNQETPGSGHSVNGSYLAVLAEEAKDADKDPVNADLLTAFLLIAVSFGATVGWLFVHGRRQGAFRSVGVDHRWSFVTTREDRPFLGVFRL
jgi:hypothetical protein